ncbi:type II/IV secretion system ATPase subunit [Candidatus Woesearchaeota archaeon]|nr:type II/IV secretion system ATPase subunit [Candidatus Woesearchaeota archaeon]
MEETNTIVSVDCNSCPFPEKHLPSSVKLSPICRKCPLITEDYDRLRLKTRLFTKEYDSQHNLMGIEPFFIDVRFDISLSDVKLMESYTLRTGAQVTIYEKVKGIGFLYFIRLPEQNVDFKDLMKLYDQVEDFKETGHTDNAIIKRWYQEFGILEHLLFDEKVLEVNINPPAYKTAIRIVHADYDECVSNVFSSDDSLDYLALRLKLSTGRPLNRAQPQLDGEIHIEDQKARVSTIVDPFSVYGTAFSIRKHRRHPWTLPLFLTKKSINPWFAGLMSFAIMQGRSFLVAGPRGSGKTALLGSLLLELLPKYRMITIEDTQELPIDSYKDLGYDILPMKVRSALSDEGMEMPFDKGLRTSLRLGDSALIVGEIRSVEAKVLYEAMRVGAMANVVAGTIHGDSPYGVFDRVVNDLGVPPGSFKVTDLIVIANQVKLPGGLKRVRRVLSVTEVTKHWVSEPEFQPLLVWNPQTDTLEPSKELLEGKSVLLNTVLQVARGYRNYNDILKEIQLRGWAKEMHLKLAPDPSFLEAQFVSPVNIRFTKLFEKNLPLESDENMKRFQREFLDSLQQVFKQSKYKGNLKYTRDQPQQPAAAGPSTANKVKELLKR